MEPGRKNGVTPGNDTTTPDEMPNLSKRITGIESTLSKLEQLMREISKDNKKI